MEHPRCHLHFLHIHTVIKLIVYIKKNYVKKIDVHVTYGLFHVIVIVIIILSLSQYAHCDWSILQVILYCTAR